MDKFPWWDEEGEHESNEAALFYNGKWYSYMNFSWRDWEPVEDILQKMWKYLNYEHKANDEANEGKEA